MSSGVKSSLSHEERTNSEPRAKVLHDVQIGKIDQINSNVRLFKLKIVGDEHGASFLPGQWLDVFVPGLEKAGGFTITSTPRSALPREYPASGLTTTEHDALSPFLELAVQNSPHNPPAAFLWRPASEILNSRLRVRIGGSFVWPPPDLNPSSVNRIVFVAGGVGINPLISIISHLHETNQMPKFAAFVYATKLRDTRLEKPETVLFLDRLQTIAASYPPERFDLRLCITDRNLSDIDVVAGSNVMVGRDSAERYIFDLMKPEKPSNATLPLQSSIPSEPLFYICGPPHMTDFYVHSLSQYGVPSNQVLCERWW